VIDPVKQGFDVALQIFPPSSEELVSRRLFPVRRIFCASPEYLKRRGTPKHPRDLFGHRLGLYSGYPTRDRWAFHHERDEPVLLDLKPTLMSNSVCLPTLVASEWIVKGQLKLILGDFQLSSFWLSAVYPRTQRGAFKLRLFIESLAASFAGGEPPWDKALIERGLIGPTLIED
jgi:DNA-binding transcriptional LysR family regulator